jgi:hypothetical protein
MGISLHALERLQTMKLLPAGASVLDIGSSNLYSATPDGLRHFLSQHDFVEAGTMNSSSVSQQTVMMPGNRWGRATQPCASLPMTRSLRRQEQLICPSSEFGHPLLFPIVLV